MFNLLIFLIFLAACSVLELGSDYKSPPRVTRPVAVIFNRTSSTTFFYGSPNGKDTANICTDSANPCTAQGAINAAQKIGKSWVNVRLASGIYNSGLLITSPLGIQITGNSSKTTQISVSGSGCNVEPNAIIADLKAQVMIGSISLTTNCPSGSDLVADDMSQIFTSNSDIVLGAAPWAHSYATNLSHIYFEYSFIIMGNGNYGFLASNSNITIGTTDSVTLTGTPEFPDGVFTAIDNGFINLANTFVGEASGLRYNLAINSEIDAEQLATPLPGSVPGVTAYSSFCFPTSAC